MQWQWVVAGLMGVGLSAACGFRVFVPMLVACIAANAGMVTLSPGFQWLASDVALVAFALATVLEIAAYYIPWLDHAFDVIATPCALVAGTLLTASFLIGMDPALKWTLAAVAGGGSAGAVQLITVGARAVSTTVTGGLGNWLVATCETVLAILVAIAAIVLPIVAILAITAILLYLITRLTRRRTPVVVQAV